MPGSSKVIDAVRPVLRIMVDEHVEHVPVVEDGRLVGICTRTDLLQVRRRQFDLERFRPRRREAPGTARGDGPAVSRR